MTIIYCDALDPRRDVAVYLGPGSVVLMPTNRGRGRVIRLTPEDAEGLAADLIRHAAAFRASAAQAALTEGAGE